MHTNNNETLNELLRFKKIIRSRMRRNNIAIIKAKSALEKNMIGEVQEQLAQALTDIQASIEHHAPKRPEPRLPTESEMVDAYAQALLEGAS